VQQARQRDAARQGENTVSDLQAIDQNKISALRREAERIEEDATYSSKSHFNAEST
jgi:hypothetical protein